MPLSPVPGKGKFQWLNSSSTRRGQSASARRRSRVPQKKRYRNSFIQNSSKIVFCLGIPFMSRADESFKEHSDLGRKPPRPSIACDSPGPIAIHGVDTPKICGFSAIYTAASGATSRENPHLWMSFCSPFACGRSVSAHQDVDNLREFPVDTCGGHLIAGKRRRKKWNK